MTFIKHFICFLLALVVSSAMAQSGEAIPLKFAQRYSAEEEQRYGEKVRVLIFKDEAVRAEGGAQFYVCRLPNKASKQHQTCKDRAGNDQWESIHDIVIDGFYLELHTLTISQSTSKLVLYFKRPN